MRNAIEIGNDFIVTTDNSGGIGEKSADFVTVPDRVTAHFAARVTLLEQWSANAEPVTVLIHNFSGSSSWENYVQGVKDLFQEVGLDVPSISGSTETNIELVQSAVAVTMIGKKKEVRPVGDLTWFTYGTPLVGEEVIVRADEVASVRKIYEAINRGVVHRIWPVGSKGIVEEIRNMTGNNEAVVETVLDTKKSAGPSTVVLLAISAEKLAEAKSLFGAHLKDIHIE
ncbi:hypothetical protein [Sporosarcina sp. G11-34]|uniref:hypothetical protein n=1 Tax=Sporosarcina sp. G11-34 TaxID=2849605 RepID=UPI0022A996FB|nr:hypothetical protein [Sporosarcina sp. G11-34]MCZ2260699.1 hypothetical protein [Sporosarcina sp. G11-34]